MPSDVDLLQQAHREVNRAMQDMAAVEIEHGRGRSVSGDGGTYVTGGDHAVDRGIRALVGFEDDDLAALMLGGVQEQVGVAEEALRAGGAPLRAALSGLFLSGFAHGKRFAELRGERDAA